jgi:hypothetical protein
MEREKKKSERNSSFTVCQRIIVQHKRLEPRYIREGIHHSNDYEKRNSEPAAAMQIKGWHEMKTTAWKGKTGQHTQTPVSNHGGAKCKKLTREKLCTTDGLSSTSASHRK